MEKFGWFLGHLVVAVIFSVLASLFGHIATVFLVLFCVGMFILAIASTLMQDSTGIPRTIIFYIGLALLIIPSVVLNIMCIASNDGTIFQTAYFAICASLAFTIWLECGLADWVHCYMDIVAIGWALLLSAIVYGITKGAAWLPVFFLIAGIIILVVMLIMRIKNGSAFDY